MSEVRTIQVVTTKPTSTPMMIVRQFVLWAYLIGAEAVSHIWFGGSWVVDIMVIVLMFVYGYGKYSTGQGFSVEMTSADIKKWVADGMPPDIKEWKKQ